jgi:hypothetical protein
MMMNFKGRGEGRQLRQEESVNKRIDNDEK